MKKKTIHITIPNWEKKKNKHRRKKKKLWWNSEIKKEEERRIKEIMIYVCCNSDANRILTSHSSQVELVRSNFQHSDHENQSQRNFLQILSFLPETCTEICYRTICASLWSVYYDTLTDMRRWIVTLIFITHIINLWWAFFHWLPRVNHTS